MNLYKLNQESVDNLYNNIKTNYDQVKFKYIDDHSIGFNIEIDNLNFVNGSINVHEIKLIENSDPNSDFHNAKIIYTSLSEKFTAEDADDERLWAYLTHFIFFKYSQIRWIKENTSKETIEDRFFYKGNGRVARTRNAIARIWWIPFLTFNPNGNSEEEKWKYTKAAFSTQEVIVSLFERTMGSYQNIRTIFLEYIINNNPQSKEIQYLARKLNNLGGVLMLPYLDNQKINEILSQEHEIHMQSQNDD